MKLYRCIGLGETEAHFWKNDFEIGETYKGIEYGNKTLWINEKYVDASQFQEVKEIKLIDCVLDAYNKMPGMFFGNDLTAKVYNPNNSHGGTITRSLRRLRKYGKINYNSDNTGKYTRL